MASAETQPALDLEPTPPEVKRYQKQKLTAALAKTILGLAFLAVLGIWFGPGLGTWLTDGLGDRDWLRLLFMAAVIGIGMEALTFPIAYWSGFLLEHRYQLSNQTLAGWIRHRIKGYLVGGVIGTILLFGLYGIMWWTGEWWWLWAAGGWLLVTLILGQLVPVLILPLFYKVTPLNDPSLVDRLQRLAQGTGLTLAGVFRLHLSSETKKANAALAGLGRTRRVLLGDTLLEQFTPEEIEVVFAHEVGHHVHRHLPKMIVISVLLAMVGFWLVHFLLGQIAPALGYQSYADPAALPLLLLVLTCFGLLMSPAQNALSRFFERQCDRYALDRTKLPVAYRSAFVKLARINKSDPDPNPLVAWLFYDHPPIRQRLAMAEN
ncbi:MAG TPA: M48 family metallopeptidase [Gemmataceae bacterium]|nr:M48 family metallopeptidase [Gemmataceae bacterium]